VKVWQSASSVCDARRQLFKGDIEDIEQFSGKVSLDYSIWVLRGVESRIRVASVNVALPGYFEKTQLNVHRDHGGFVNGFVPQCA
jgi:hypothetical protein